MIFQSDSNQTQAISKHKSSLVGYGAKVERVLN